MQQRYLFVIAACLTLGLAPFLPQPHLVEKIRWLSAGTPQLRPIDWFDLVMHGAPWIILIGMSIYDFVAFLRA